MSKSWHWETTFNEEVGGADIWLQNFLNEKSILPGEFVILEKNESFISIMAFY